MDGDKQKSGPKRTTAQRERDLITLSERYLKGIPQVEIAVELSVTQQQVSHDLGILRRRWLAAADANIKEAKAKELARIDQLEIEYWQAWERSVTAGGYKTIKTKGKIVQTEAGDTGFVKEQPAETTQVTEPGDPRFLIGVQWCIDRRCKVLGLDAPQRWAPTNPDGTGEFSGGLVILPAKGGDGK